MAESKTIRAERRKTAVKTKDRAAEIANTFEWLITAFILAFVFRAFVMEAFRIPTGSMADTLKGAHFRLRCPQCGYRYDHGFVPQNYGMHEDTIPPGPIPIRQQTRCPSCGFAAPAGVQVPVANGDRILVLKCIYQFLEPNRWDVVVFKNPTNPTENYIKRLIGLPGETVEIKDGDIYINGVIARKPPAVQKELWMPIYDHDFQPVNPNERAGFNTHRWVPPFDLEDSTWRIDPDDPTRLRLDVPAADVSVLTYGAPSANGFAVTYAYNEPPPYGHPPTCSDLMFRFWVEPTDATGRVGATLSKNGVDYRGWLDFSGRMVIAKVDNGQEQTLAETEVKPPTPGVFAPVKFANVDHRLMLNYDGEELIVDLGRDPNAMGRNGEHDPRAELLGSGKLTLAHLALFRDTYYTSDGQSGRNARAIEGRPFTLDENEFFVLGDNSPNSEDGRWWGRPEVASKGWEPPRAGVVPRYYLVGKALFVYWPSGFEFPWPREVKNMLLSGSRESVLVRLLRGIVSLRWIPNVGQLRFIYGGVPERTPPPRPQSDAS